MSELILLAALLALVWLMQMRYRLPDTRPAAAWQRELPRSAFPALRIRSRVAFSNLLTTHESYGDRAVAVSNCAAGHGQSRRHFTATRRESCLDLQLQYGGEAACAWACLGAGDCVTACPEDAIRMEGGSPRIDTQACTGCGQCVTSCPRQVLSLIPADAQIYMACASADEPAFRQSVCEVGCRDTRQCLGDRFLTPGIVRADGRTQGFGLHAFGQSVAAARTLPGGCVPRPHFTSSPVFCERLLHRLWSVYAGLPGRGLYCARGCSRRNACRS